MSVSRCKRSFRWVPTAAAVFGGLLLLVGLASAHTDPAGILGTGVGHGVFAFQDSTCTTPLPGPVSECGASVYFQARLTPQTGNRAFEGGSWNMTLPDGTVVNLITVVGGGVVPCVGGTADDAAMPGGRGDCFPTRTQHLSACIGYTTNDADLVGGFWTTSVTYVNWFDHVGVNDTQNTSGGITNNVPVPADLCDEEGTGECQGDATCDFQTGTCTPPANIPGPCTDTDNNECTIAQCEAGVCDQTNPVSNGSACDDFNGQFDALCASQSCQAGECVLDTETNEGDPCTEDASECTADLCVEGICEHPPLDPLPEECRGDFICRTCGFWGNHPDIVQELLDNADPPIQVCGGEEMDTTEPEDNSSANEAICVR